MRTEGLRRRLQGVQKWNKGFLQPTVCILIEENVPECGIKMKQNCFQEAQTWFYYSSLSKRLCHFYFPTQWEFIVIMQTTVTAQHLPITTSISTGSFNYLSAGSLFYFFQWPDCQLLFASRVKQHDVSFLTSVGEKKQFLNLRQISP